MAAPEVALQTLIETIAARAGEMLDAARAGAWEDLARLEADRRPLLDEWCRRSERGESPPASARAAMEILLARDTEVQALVAGRLEDLAGDIRAVGNRKRLLRAYGA